MLLAPELCGVFLGGREGAKELGERGRKDAVRIGSGPNISSLAWLPDAIEISGTNGNTGGGMILTT